MEQSEKLESTPVLITLDNTAARANLVKNQEAILKLIETWENLGLRTELKKDELAICTSPEVAESLEVAFRQFTKNSKLGITPEMVGILIEFTNFLKFGNLPDRSCSSRVLSMKHCV